MAFQPNVNPVPKNAETVINLLNYQLSETEFNVLNEGLTFIPTPKISHIHQSWKLLPDSDGILIATVL